MQDASDTEGGWIDIGNKKNNATYHVPVLLEQVIQGLQINPSGTYVDCTFGGGGHSAAILGKLNANGRLVAFDQDEEVEQNLPKDERIIFVPQNFRHLKRFLRLHKIEAVDGILADLGVSSHQLNTAGRGFSTRFDAALDMRMDQRQKTAAFDIIDTYSELELHKLFERYGEITNAKTLARTIVESRQSRSLKTIEAFKGALYAIVKGNPNKYFAQVFQALRMEVNEEIVVLRELLEQAKQVLKQGGRIVVVTFHSIEDREVKVFFREGSFEKKDTNPFLNEEQHKVFKIITKKPITAKADELMLNPRSRSAKLRVAEKL